MIDTIFKEYELSIKENSNIIESEIDMLEVNAHTLYMLESEGYVASDTEANDLFLENVAKLMNKIKKFFNDILTKMKELIIKIKNKFTIWKKQKEINILISVWKKTLSNNKIAQMIKTQGDIKVFNQNEYIKEYETFLKFASSQCKNLKSQKYNNIDEYNKTAKKIKTDIFDTMDKLEKPYENTDVISWINNGNLENWEADIKKVLNNTEKVINEIKSYTCTEDDLNKIKDYQKIASIIALSFSESTKIMYNEIINNFNKCNSALKAANQKLNKEIKDKSSSKNKG